MAELCLRSQSTHQVRLVDETLKPRNWIYKARFPFSGNESLGTGVKIHQVSDEEGEKLSLSDKQNVIAPRPHSMGQI